MKKIELKHSNEPICPWCEYKHRDAFEWEGDEGDMECEKCGRKFVYQRLKEISYNTEAII